MRIGSIVIRCYEFDKMLAFWQEVVHYIPREPSDGSWVVLRDPQGRGPNISLQRVSERRLGKRSRLHLDLYTNDRKGEVGSEGASPVPEREDKPKLPTHSATRNPDQGSTWDFWRALPCASKAPRRDLLLFAFDSSWVFPEQPAAIRATFLWECAAAGNQRS